MNSTDLSSSSFALSSGWSSLLLNLSVEFFFQLSCILQLWVFCLVLLRDFLSLLKFSLCSCIIFLNFLTVISNSSQVNHLSLFNCNLLLDIYLVLLFATHFPVSSFSLTLCVGFCTLDKIATSPSLDRMVLYRGWTWPELLVSLKRLWLSKPPPLFLVTFSSWGCTKDLSVC